MSAFSCNHVTRRTRARGWGSDGGYGTTDTGSATIALFGDLGSATGRSVATGDEDGDGLAEVLIGAPYDDEAGAVSGSVYLFHAADLGL